jgi:hypothetical protein
MEALRKSESDPGTVSDGCFLWSLTFTAADLPNADV